MVGGKAPFHLLTSQAFQKPPRLRHATALTCIASAFQKQLFSLRNKTSVFDVTISNIDPSLLNALRLDNNSLQILAWLERRPRLSHTGYSCQEVYTRKASPGMELTRAGREVLMVLRVPA